MKLPVRLTGRRRVAVIAGVSTLLAAGLIAIPTAAYAAPGCSVTYTKTWDNGSGFGADVVITNTGDPITNGWSLVFTFPNNQQVGGGWPVAFSQSGQTVTISSNAEWNRSIATNATFNTGFNGSYSGTNNNPTAFTLNGTACNGGGTNTPPTVSFTSPTPNQSFPAGSTVTLAANAADPGGAVARVEFRVDGNLVNTDSTAPYSFAVAGLASGSHTATATAVDNGSPALSAVATVTFSIGQVTTPTLAAAPSALNLAGGASGTVNISRNPSTTSSVTVSITRTGSTALTCPTSVTLPANSTTAVSITCTAATGTTAATATFAVAAAGHNGTSFTVNRNGPGRVDNPYAGAGVYVNPDWAANANSVSGGNRIANQPTAVWMDRRAAINNNPAGCTPGSAGCARGLVSHLDGAVAQDAANGATPMVFQVVIYNLPGRDCSALASNGELGPDDLPIYQSQYIDVIREILGRPAYASLRIVAIIEIDSLPNLVTNITPRPTAVPECDVMNANGGYVNGVGYAIARLGSLPNVYNYIDAAHHGWIGWDDNFGATAQKLAQAANANGASPSLVTGFIVNTANYSALTEQFVGTVTEQIRPSTWIDWNRYNEELAFAQAFRNQAVSAGFPSNVGMLIDTSRNGWGNCVVAPCAAGAGTSTTRPTQTIPSSDINTYVNQNRIDRRIHKGNWCNQAGAGLGERPMSGGLARSNPAPGIDAYVWVKPPGESDGSSTEIPNDEGKGFDRMCDPTYGGNARNGQSMSGALPNSPLSGHWFPAQLTQLMANAFPAL
jgi:cellulose 1,4-beta-cellobiosidase